MSKKQNHSQEFNELEGAAPYVVITADPHLELQVVDAEFNQIDYVRASWIGDKEEWEADADSRLLAAGWKRTSEWRTTGCDVTRVGGAE